MLDKRLRSSERVYLHPGATGGNNGGKSHLATISCPQMPLTDIECKKAKPRATTYKLFDGGGLYLEVTPKGGKWWRLKYRFAGKENRISLGVFPEVGLKAARTRCMEQRRLLGEGIDPSRHRQLTERKLHESMANSFETVAREWISKQEQTWAQTHTQKVIQRLERDVFPWIGKHPVADIKSPELLSVLRRIEKRGAVDTARRAGQNCGQVFRYAIASGLAESDPSVALRGALLSAQHEHYASIKDPVDIGALMRALQTCRGSFAAQSALRLAPYVFVRPGELRGAEWAEIDLDAAEWRIRAERMKMRQVHIVPLSKQVVDILRDVQKVTGEGTLVFPGSKRGKPISDGTLRASLMDLGYSGDVQTVHGFRSMASTLLYSTSRAITVTGLSASSLTESVAWCGRRTTLPSICQSAGR